MLLYIFLIISLINSQPFDSISIPYQLVQGTPTIIIKFEELPSFKHFKTFDLQESRTIFEHEPSQKIKNMIIRYKGIDLNFTIGSSVLILGQTYKFNYTYYSPNDGGGIIGYAKGLGLGISEEELNSFQMQMKLAKLIKKASFTFEPIKELFLSNGKIIFGELPQSSIENKYKAHCLPKENWGCFLREVSLKGKKSFTVNDYAYFKAKEESFFAPEYFMDYLYQIFFKNLVEHNKCFCQDSPSYYICDKDVIKDFPSLEIKFAESNFTFNSSLLFVKEMEKVIFKVSKSRNDDWIFSSIFLNNFITEFNEEDMLINFYSDHPFQINPLFDSEIRSSLLLSNTILTSFGIIAIIIQLYFNK